jgi:predicted nucleotidyltransferase
MNFGLTSDEIALLRKIVMIPLTKWGVKTYIFGSRARGKYHRFSDVDLLFEQAPNQLIPIAEISEIRENLENSNFPYKVDLVDSLNLAASYRTQVNQEKILFF